MNAQSRPYHEPISAPVWTERTQRAARAIATPMEPEAAVRAIESELQCTPTEATMVLSVADTKTVWYRDGLWSNRP